MLYLVILALAAVAVGQVAPLLRFDKPMRDLDRFWTARQLTTGWARGVDEG
ncbi:MAG TPA: hypothetical protein VMZ11_06185 [Mycobacteriales bacterium]|nr:hypothetical protein [Mycobacteriales bacterium]